MPASNPPEQIKESRRLGFIEGMRGVAAFYVMLQHICTMIDPYRSLARPDAKPTWLAWLTTPLWYGHLAVAAFIVISGFCLQLSLYTRGDGRLTDVKAFLLRRCRRILPPYYACLVLSLFVAYLVTGRQVGQPWSQYLPVTAQNVLAHVFMIHNFSTEWMYKINGVLWSIAIEFQLYFGFPVMCAWLWKRGSAWLLTPTTAIAAALLLVAPVSEKLYVWYLPLFALGMVAARIAFDKELSRPSPLSLTTAAGVSFVIGCLAIGWTKELYPSDIFVSIAVACVLVLGSIESDHPVPSVFGWKPLTVVGAFSYSLYLIHHPLLQCIFVLRPEVISTPVRQFAYLVVVGIPIILGLVYLFYLRFEKPFIRSRPEASGTNTT